MLVRAGTTVHQVLHWFLPWGTVLRTGLCAGDEGREEGNSEETERGTETWGPEETCLRSHTEWVTEPGTKPCSI